MPFREKLVKQTLFRQTVWSVFGGLPALITHHVALIRQLIDIQRADEISHAVAFQPKSQFQLIRGNRLVIIRSIEIRRSVNVCRARPFEVREVRLSSDMLLALEHHVLEQVRESCPSRALIRWPDVVPKIYRDQRQRVVLGQNHFQSILQPVFLERNGRQLSPRRLRRRLRTRAGNQSHKNQQRLCQNPHVKTDHYRSLLSCFSQTYLSERLLLRKCSLPAL